MGEPLSSRVQVALAVSFHITVALTVTLCNKAVLNTLPLPVTLLLVQSLMTIAFVHIGALFNLCSIPSLRLDVLRSLLPLLVARVVAQLSKIYCLQNVNASFYQIARGLLLPFSIVLSAAFLANSKPSRLALLACAVTMLGFGFGVSGEKLGQTSTAGILWGVWSSLTTAVETIVIKRFVSGLKLGVLDLVYASVVAMTPVFMLCVALNGELAHVVALNAADPQTLRFGGQVLVAGVFNFLLSIAAFLQIKTTSPTTHMISTAARGVLQSLLAVAFMSNEHLSPSRMLSIGVILSGSLFYTYAKELETRKRAAEEHLPLHEVEAKEPLMEESRGKSSS